VKVVRIVTSAAGKVIHKDTFVSIWPMLARQIEIGTGTGSTTTTTVKATTTTTAAPTTTTSAPPAT
jgi:hypothetical protein